MIRQLLTRFAGPSRGRSAARHRHIVGGTRKGLIDHETAKWREGDHGAREIIAEERRRQWCVDEAGGDEIHSDRPRSSARLAMNAGMAAVAGHCHCWLLALI